MTTLQTADGRLLRQQRPAGATGAFTGVFPPLWSSGETVASTATGNLVSFEQIYRSQPVIAAAVDKLARRIATLPFDAYKKGAGDLTRELTEGDSLDTLLRKPMPRVSKVYLLHQIGQSLLIHGNAVVAKVRGGDAEAPPTMLWPLDWAHMSAYGPVGGRLEWWSTTQFEGVERYIQVEDTLHFAWGAPSGELGVSPLEKLGVTITLEDAAQRHQTASFRNGNRPSLAVSLAMDNPKPEVLEYARQRVEAMHKGPDNSGRTFFMGANVKAQPLSLTPVEAALIDQRKLSREEVGMVYDLAGPLMNDLTHATLTNVVELNKALYRDVIPPWTTLIEQTVQAQLLDTESAWFQHSVAFDFSDKLKGEPDVLAATLKTEVEAGLITRNEARRILNLPPDGDPNDPANPANQLTANVNNQAPVATMQSGPNPPAPPADGAASIVSPT